MRRLLLSGLMVLAFSVTAFAGVDVSKLQLPGDITQAQADTVIKGALAKAKEQGVPMNIAVVDAGGNLKAFTRMDGAFLGSIDISIGKARTARLFNMPTSALGAASQPGKELYGIEVTNNGLVIFGGGELLKNKDGVIVCGCTPSGRCGRNSRRGTTRGRRGAVCRLRVHVRRRRGGCCPRHRGVRRATVPSG